MSDIGGDSSTREALIQATIRVVGTRGLRGSTLRAIAAEAGLTHGMIVHYFGTRAALLRAAMEFSIARTLATSRPDRPGAGMPRLGDHVREVAADAEGVVAFQREVLNEVARDHSLRPLAVAMWSQFDAAVSAQLADAGVQDADAVVFFGAVVEGLMRRQMDLGGEADIEGALAMLDRVVSMHASQATP